MAAVQTLRGPTDSADLGRVLIHEHIFLMDMEYTYNYREDFFAEKTIIDAAARLNELKASGVDTIIDLTVLGLGRHVPSMARVRHLTDLNIVASTGAYTFADEPAPFQFYGPGKLHHVDEDPLVEHFVRDITKGMAGTDIKAGMLKCAIDMPGLTKGVERIMRAVGKANRITGTPITVHTAPAAQTGLIAQRVLGEEGVDLENVVIGHCGDSKDIDYLSKLADQGSILGMDRFGVDFTITTVERVATIVEMIGRGYVDQLTLSHDCCAWSDFFPAVEHYHQAMPNHHYLHIHQDVIPALREAGVSDADLDAMFVHNPRRYFEGAAERFARTG